jgi:phospholipid/cholesterol/gamma-HCH transport system ATP-binding protein
LASGNGSAGRNGASQREIILKVRQLTVALSGKTILEKLDLDLFRGEILSIVGGSGTGKSVLLRAILGLIPVRSGSIEILGVDYASAPPDERLRVDRRLGVLFQQGALFSSLSVLDNVQLPMREHLRLSPRLMSELAKLKLSLVGFPVDAILKRPSELSGGMIKRAGLARALALDPEILFLDEPTSGLDPIGAGEFDELIETLRDTLGLSVIMITHDLDSLHRVCDRIAVLAERRVLVEGTLETVLANEHPWVKSYFQGPRGRAALRG